MLQFNALVGHYTSYEPGRTLGPIAEAACNAHARQKFIEFAGLTIIANAKADPAPIFELGEHVFDFVALTVEFFVILDGLLLVFWPWDAGHGPPLYQRVAKPAAVIDPVGDQRSGLCQIRD
jgi:hypothetical protein